MKKNAGSDGTNDGEIVRENIATVMSSIKALDLALAEWM